jgi:Domain of unknown function (DUF4372)/Transposase DDE domain
MRKGKLVLAQLSEHLPKSVFAQCVARYAGRYPTLTFSHWSQLLCMMFAQLTGRASLRDIALCLASQRAKLYHAGFRGPVARSTLADANERRDSRIFEDFALHLIGIARPLYARDSWAVELAQTVYAIDASTVDLCLSLFDWAPAAKGRAGVKLHTLLDLRGNIPAFIRVTGSRVSDASFLDHLRLEAGSFYVMDRGYVHFARLMRFTRCAAFFVVRSKYRLHYRVLHADLSNEALGVLKDEHILLTGKHTRADYPVMLRRIEIVEAEQGRRFTLMTNHFELAAPVIAQLYKSRWQVELFFKWIKQNLRIKAFVGTSPNAVKTQIWSAVCTYVLVAIVKKRLGIDASLRAILQVLSLTLFEATPLDELLGQIDEDEPAHLANDQISLFDEISGQ